MSLSPKTTSSLHVFPDQAHEYVSKSQLVRENPHPSNLNLPDEMLDLGHK